MKVLWVTVGPLDQPGYRATQFGMASALEKLGLNIDFLAKSEYTEPFAGFPGYDGKVTLIPRKNLFITEIKQHVMLWRLMARKSFDIVFFEQSKLSLILLPAILSRVRILKTRFVLDIRTPLLEENLHDYIAQFNYWLAMKFAKYFLPGITVITEELWRDLEPLVGKKVPVLIWESGVDPEMFDPSSISPISRNSLDIRQSIIFFYHGSLTVSRGLAALISAMKKLNEEHPEAALVLLGDGPGEAALRKQAHDLRLDYIVYFFHAVPNNDVPKFIAMADVGVIPLPIKRCWQVSSPLKLFEYMAMRLPIVVSDIAAHRTVLGNKPFAIYVKDVNPRSLHKALKSSIENLMKLKKSAYQGREMVINHYSWIKHAEKLAAFFHLICRQGS